MDLDGAQEEGEDDEDEEQEDSQLTLSDSAFESQEQQRGHREVSAGRGASARVQHRKEAYKTVREGRAEGWEGLVSSGSGCGREEVEL